MNESVFPRASIRRSADKVRTDVSLSLPDSTKCTLQKKGQVILLISHSVTFDVVPAFALIPVKTTN